VSASPAPLSLRETPLSPRLVVLTSGGDLIHTSWGVNCTAFATVGGTVLVDPMIAPFHARLVDEAIRRRGFPEVRHVVLTHHHTDHALGASWFASRGATVVAHVRCADAMAAEHAATIDARRRVPELAALFADASPYSPTITFEERHVIGLGDVEIEVRHLGPGHTQGDAVIIFESESAVACGDLVFAGYHFNYEDADAQQLERRLEELAKLPVSVFVPGHGLPGGREILEEQARYHAEVQRLVHSAPDAATARAAIEARFVGRALPDAILTAVAAFGHAAVERPAWD